MNNTRKPLDITMTVTSVRSNTSGYTELRLTSDAGLIPSVRPGQFVNVRITDVPEVFLRRPISINDAGESAITILVKDAGKGTHRLCTARPGDRFDILMPLGNGYSTDNVEGKRILLIGGGVGSAPLLYLGKCLKSAGADIEFLLGSRTAEDLMQRTEFADIAKVNIATEDGSAGTKGFVTAHPVLDRHFDRYCVCGPMPMMRAVAKIAVEKNVDCEVSLENRMSCGLGACLCCVEDTVEGNVCTCTEGPVFNLKELKW